MKIYIDNKYLNDSISNIQNITFLSSASCFLMMILAFRYLGDAALGWSYIIFLVLGYVGCIAYGRRKRALRAAPYLWLEILDGKIIYGSPQGETVIYISQIEKIVIKDAKWPTIKIDLFNGDKFSFQGFNDIRSIYSGLLDAVKGTSQNDNSVTFSL